MEIRKINPNNEKDIRAMDKLERSSFELTGNDPTECSEVLKYIAQEGVIFLGYETVKIGEKIPDDLDDVVVTNEAKEVIEIPVGFIELITLDKGLEFYKANKNNKKLEKSPFIISKGEADRIYKFARKYASDSDIVDHHGIGIHEKYQDEKRGNQLLKHAMNSNFVKGKVVDCNIDIAVKEGDGLADIFNDRSFAIHFNNNFISVGILQPPLYDNDIIYTPTLKIPGLEFEGTTRYLNIKKLRENPIDLVREIDKLAKEDYVGTYYNKIDQSMRFIKIK